MMGRVTAALIFVLGLLPAWPVAAQDVTVDRVLRLISEHMLEPGDSLRSTIVASDRYALSAAGRHVTVTTRFLRETSANGLAAAVARDLLSDPVEFTVVLDRAGFDGLRGLRELSDRVARLMTWEAQARAAVNAAYQEWRAEVDANSFNSVARPGYQVMYAARREALQARYEQWRREYEAFVAGLPSAYAMNLVHPAFLSAVTEIAAVLRGASPIELSPWAPRIRDALKAHEEARR